jgi:hypothetical protein
VDSEGMDVVHEEISGSSEPCSDEDGCPSDTLVRDQ